MLKKALMMTGVFVLSAFTAYQANALTVSEAITAAETAGYSVIAVRTDRDGSAVSVLVTDGTSYYDVVYDTSTGEATSTTSVTLRSDETAASSTDVAAAIAAAEAAGYTVVGVRSTSSGVEVMATDGTTLYEVSYDSSTATATTSEATRGGGRHGRDHSGDTDSTTDTTTTETTTDTTSDTSTGTHEHHSGGRERDGGGKGRR